MESEDVIELGSSDDEAEPIPKKKKLVPDALVHIPVKLSGITIKPSNPAPSYPTGVLAKEILIKKLNDKASTAIDQLKYIPAAIKKPMLKRVRNAIESKIPPILQNQVSINPISLAKNLSRRQLVVKRVPQNKLRNTKDLMQKVEIRPKVFNTLPPSITIKPVNTNIKIRPLENACGSGGHLKRRRVPPKNKPPEELLTVELDDEDISETVTSGPQWYLRPEDQTKKIKSRGDDNDKATLTTSTVSVEPSMEEKNNKEPDTRKYVEITIEDSPLKPVHSEHPDIGKELTITIEDSPVKPISKVKKDVESDNEMSEVIEDKQSKKKLDYPRLPKNQGENHIVEIEIDLKETNSVTESENNSKFALTKHKHIVETEKSPEYKSGEEKVTNCNMDNIVEDKEIVIEDGEFHPTYQKFIHMCFQLENTDDMKKIVEKKIKAYYRQCPKEYVESEEFIDMVSSKIDSMKASPEKMYLYIKDIVDELNLQRKMTKSLVSNVNMMPTDKESSESVYEESKFDSKKQRQIRKLEKTIKKLHRAIQKLEEQEVDFDDDEDSVYLLTERYKERMVRVHTKFCQLTNTKMPSEPRIHIEARPGKPTGPVKKLEKWINRKVPIGTPLPFPDFHDVLRCVREANEEDKLGWTDVDIMEEARDLFTRCGKKLQRRRQENEWRIAASRITTVVDPAENNSDLKKKLDDNKTVAAKKETELFNKYVDRQNLLKLEAVEIGDKEAEESPLESEEEEDINEIDNSLEDKQKRKQRLKRLLQEKSKKDEEKENIVRKDSEDKENKKETCTKDTQENDQEKVIDKNEIKDDKSNNLEISVESMPNETEITEKEDEEIEIDNRENKEDEYNDDSDAYKVESDIDELHLLQKLHSENEVNSSSCESSDSDTLQSNSDVENGAKPCDVISIENSSYSESEMIIDETSKENDTNTFSNQKFKKLVTANIEIEYSSTGLQETNKETLAVPNALVEDIEENILLASSDEEAKDKVDNIEILDTFINLRDDNISISETTIEGKTVEEGNIINDESSVLDSNNAIEIIEDNTSSEKNYDNENNEDNYDFSKSIDITEYSNEQSEVTKDSGESGTQIKVPETEASNCETIVEI